MDTRNSRGPVGGPHRRRVVLRAALSAVATTAAGAVFVACGDGAAPAATQATIAPAATPAAMVAPSPTVAPAATAARSTAAPAVGTTPAAQPTTASAMATTAPAAPATPVVPPASAAPAATDGKLPAPAPGVPDAYLKPPAPFRSVNAVPGRQSKVSIFLISGLAPVPPRDQNAYLRELEKRLGATMDYTVASSSTYQEKLAALTASGSLFDLTAVLFGNAPEQARVVQQGAYTDLTPFLTGDALRGFPNLAAFPPGIWKNVAIRGKIYGVPRPRFSTTNSMSFRQDWADKLGIAAPKNADEFERLLVATTKNDPDGNGRSDTFGLGTYSQNPFCLLFLQYLFRVPNEWRLQDGRLTYHLETEEFRQTLAYARRLYEAGIYHPDTASLTTEQARTLFNGSKIAGFNDFVSGLAAQRRGVVQLTPTAKVVGLVPFGHDGGKAVTYNDVGYLGFIAIPAQVGRMGAERVKELLRILDYLAAPFGSDEYTYLQNGIEGTHHTVRPDGTRVRTDQGNGEIGALPSLMNPPQTFYFPDDPDLAPYLQRYVADLVALGIDNPVAAAFSPTEAMKANELSRLRIDRAIAIITGREPLSALDTWVRDWRSRGGDMIRKEYEDALRA